jgi:hypothetical protein
VLPVIALAWAVFTVTVNDADWHVTRLACVEAPAAAGLPAVTVPQAASRPPAAIAAAMAQPRLTAAGGIVDMTFVTSLSPLSSNE